MREHTGKPVGTTKSRPVITSLWETLADFALGLAWSLEEMMSASAFVTPPRERIDDRMSLWEDMVLDGCSDWREYSGSAKQAKTHVKQAKTHVKREEDCVVPTVSHDLVVLEVVFGESRSGVGFGEE